MICPTVFRVVFLCLLYFVAFIKHTKASSVPSNISYGGVVTMTFGRLAGKNDGQSRPSGYGWWSSYHKLNDTYYVTGNTGISFLERSPIQTSSNRVQSVYTPILNDLNIGIQSNIEQFTLGRTLNAAGKLHHDISDFGAPGGGMDNTPVTSFKNGSYTTNVSQQIANSFYKRVSYFLKPLEGDYGYLNLGVSYAPHINSDNPENYEFFVGLDTDKPITLQDEISVALSSEFDNAHFTIGLTAGYTQGNRPYNNQMLPIGKITAKQYSIVFKQKSADTEHYKLYELNSGCLRDKNTNDCRGGFQYSKIQGDFTHNVGTQIRLLDKQPIPRLDCDSIKHHLNLTDADFDYVGLGCNDVIDLYYDNFSQLQYLLERVEIPIIENSFPITHYNSGNMVNFDFYTGWQWALSDNLRIGFETILRREETKKKYRQDQKGQKLNSIKTDFNWLAGVQYRF